MEYACAAIFKLTGNQGYLEKFDLANLVFMTPIKRERENTGRVNLEANTTYVLVASTEMPGKTGDFAVSIYFD